MEDYYEYLDSNGVTTLYKLIKDDTVALIDSYSVTINGITTNLDNHVNNSDIHTPITDIENMVDTKISGLVNSAPETLDTLKELSDALGNDPNFATTVVNQIGNKADKDSVYTKQETDTLLEGKANSAHNHVVSDITDFPTIPTKVSELSNDSNFVTSTELHDYATKNDLNSKQDVLSEEQLSNIDSIPDKANKSDLSTVATSGSYKDLLDKPVIPEGADLSDYYNKGETDNLLNSKANTSDLAVVAKSGNYSDLINTPTIPTKLSQLENDMGFGSGSGGVITSISWTNITDKPNFATVATSGSYNDLSNTPTIPTKVSQLENDTGFINTLTDVVDTKSNQTINGVKTFTASPFVSNYAATNGYFTKLNIIGRNEVPSQIYHSAFRVFDKNSKTLGEYCVEKSTSGSSLLHMDVHTEDSEGNDIMESLYLNLSNDGSTVSFHPAKNNRTDLGMSNYKWAKIYSDDVVHTSGDETIAGTKTFSNTTISNKELHYKDTKYDWTDKSLNVWCDAGHVAWFDKTGNRRMHELVGAQSGVWRKACYINENQYFSVDSNRNISYWGTATFNGHTIFTQDIILKDNNIDLTVTPSSTLSSNFIFKDKNNQNVSFIQYAKRDTEPDVLGLYIHDKSKNLHGIQITSNNYLLPMGNNIYNLGSPNNKWAKIYSDDVVHTSGNEIISGSKTFSNQIYLGAGGGSYGLISAKDNNSILRLFGGTSPSTGANLDLYGEGLSDGGFSLRARTSDKIVGLDGKVDGTLKWNGKNVAIDENLVHKTGREVISGDKIFQKCIYRQADITTSTVEEVYRFTDTNATPCGSIYNRMHWYNNNVYNRHQAYNATSGKDMYFEVLSHNDGSGVVNTGGSVTNNKNLTTVTNATGSTYVATMGWVNNPATSTNVVHRSGNETIAGNKTFSNKIKGNLQGNADTATSATKASYLDNYSAPNMNKIYLDWDHQKKGYVGLKVDNTVMGGLITTNNIGSQAANSATYSTTPATTDNSTRIATTAWVRTYVNSVVGSGNNTLGSSVSAYWSTSSNVTSTQQDSNERNYPECYSHYIDRTPGVGIIYSGAQLYSELNAHANATRELGGSVQNRRYITKVTAQATFSNPISSTGKYLCTTANTVSFRAYAPEGKSAASVINYSATKSIFIRVE